jgi:hypothetical protein
MFPAIADGDIVELEPVASTGRGEVVLIATKDGLRTHRIIDSAIDRVVTQGDACFQPDKPSDHTSIIGRVALVITNRRRTLRSRLSTLLRRIS